MLRPPLLCLAVSAVLLPLVGCDDGEVLELGVLAIEVEQLTVPGTGGRQPFPGTSLDDDGRILVGEEEAGRVTRDGRYLDADGTERARIDGEGRLSFGGTDVGARIDEDGTLENGTEHALRIDPDRRVHGTHPEAPRMTVKGVTQGTRRTAMFVIVLGCLSDGRRVSVGAALFPR